MVYKVNIGKKYDLKFEFIKNYYKILGIGLNSDSLQIKKAYKRLATIYHPDKNLDGLNTSEIFLEIQEAYSVLKSPESRKAYCTKLRIEYPQLVTQKIGKVYLSTIGQLEELNARYKSDLPTEERKKILFDNLINLINIQFVFELEQEIKKDNKGIAVRLIADLAKELRPSDSINFLADLNRRMKIELLAIPQLANIQRIKKQLLVWKVFYPWLILLIAAGVCILLFVLGR